MRIGKRFPRSRLSEQGISAAGVLSFIEAVEQSRLELHSFMLVRHGSVAAEGWWSPYAAGRSHQLFSISKSFTATAVGLAVAEGRLSIEDPVVSFFSNELPAGIDENLQEMRVKHLLSMSTGHAKETSDRMRDQPDGNWVKGFLSLPVDEPPGSTFVYNSGASYMLSAIVQRVAGLNLVEYLQPRLFEPLGIENVSWVSCPRGINAGGWGLSLKTEDIAKFGQLFLQKGVWNDRQILSSDWVEQATAMKIQNRSNNVDWRQGYGYQFWMCTHGAYRASGVYGQFCVVMPAQDTVLALTGGVKNNQAVLQLVWEHLLPAMQQAPLSENEAVQSALEQKLASLTLLPKFQKRDSAIAAQVSGRRYVLDENAVEAEAVSFDFGPNGCLFTLENKQGNHQAQCGIVEPIEGETTLRSQLSPIVATGTWRDEQTFVISMRFVETPFCTTITCSFEGDRLCLESIDNLGQNEPIILEGRTYTTS